MKIRKDRPEKRIVVRVPRSIQKLSTWFLIKRAFSIWLDKISVKKESFSKPDNGMPNMYNWENVDTFAIVVDNKVVDIMRAQTNLSKMLQSQPKFVKIEEDMPSVGWDFVDGKFIDSSINLDFNPENFKLGDTK